MRSPDYRHYKANRDDGGEAGGGGTELFTNLSINLIKL